MDIRWDIEKKFSFINKYPFVSFRSTSYKNSFILLEEILSSFIILVSIVPVVIIIFLDVFFDKLERKFTKTFWSIFISVKEDAFLNNFE